MRQRDGKALCLADAYLSASKLNSKSAGYEMAVNNCEVRSLIDASIIDLSVDVCLSWERVEEEKQGREEDITHTVRVSTLEVYFVKRDASTGDLQTGPEVQEGVHESSPETAILAKLWYFVFPM